MKKNKELILNRTDIYILSLGVLQTMFFFRVASLFTSGSAVWLIKQKTTMSWILLGLFIFFFLTLFNNLSKLIICYKQRESAGDLLVNTAKASIFLFVLYLALVFTLASQIG